MSSPCRVALVAPASDDRKARKALASDADVVVLDLEDAVLPADKDSAREAAAALIREFGGDRPVSVRINALGTAWADDDLATCAALDTLQSIVLPKAETPAQIVAVDRALGDSAATISALIETAIGVRDVDTIAAAAPRLESLIIGYADLAADLGRSATISRSAWEPIQDRVLIAARAAGLTVTDGPHLTIADDDDYRTTKIRVRDLGFDGTWVIHPQQIASALAIFTPDDDAIRDAERVLEALEQAADTGAGAASLDGRMLDEALAVAARRTLRKAGKDV
ncbi:HpcH/HpaI aldolase/citrate lyase family protein [Gordonia hydrophobica]|uniref:CoA ester lyase n=1 Tax=Gordonia hydrophobica TaxID=40516 RepID=A0ABZ2TZ86_9ACTN|nr:CoA ester lyase [Gordonia hydrophobica]